MARFIVKRFDHHFNPQQNAFGFVRLIMALGVIVSHSWAIGGFGEDPLWYFSHERISYGFICVMFFFSISGFLIVRSQETLRSPIRFMWHRFLRVFPAFWVQLLSTAIFFVPLYCWFEGRPIVQFFEANFLVIKHYLTDNFLIRIHYWSIPPLLGNNPKPFTINGSLWSLIHEWHCYLLVLISGLLAQVNKEFGRVFILLATPASWALGISYTDPTPNTIMMMPYFLFGAAMYILRAKIPSHWSIFVLAIVLIPIGLTFEIMSILGPPAISYAAIWLATALPPQLSWFDNGRDISYGIYIYSYPVQQALTLAGMNELGLLRYMMISVAWVVIFGVLSWHLIEKPALRLKAWTPNAAR